MVVYESLQTNDIYVNVTMIKFTKFFVAVRLRLSWKTLITKFIPHFNLRGKTLAGFVIYDICRSSRIKVQLHLRLLSGRVPNAQPYQ